MLENSTEMDKDVDENVLSNYAEWNGRKEAYSVADKGRNTDYEPCNNCCSMPNDVEEPGKDR